MIINNLVCRLKLGKSGGDLREAERRRVKEATRGLRSQAEKIAWHLAEMASLGLGAGDRPAGGGEPGRASAGAGPLGKA